MIRIGREIQCLPYAGFVLYSFPNSKNKTKYTIPSKDVFLINLLLVL